MKGDILGQRFYILLQLSQYCFEENKYVKIHTVILRTTAKEITKLFLKINLEIKMALVKY